MQEIFREFFVKRENSAFWKNLLFAYGCAIMKQRPFGFILLFYPFFEKNVVFQKITLRRVLHVTLRDVV